MEKLKRQKKYIAAGKLKQFISNLNNAITGLCYLPSSD